MRTLGLVLEPALGSAPPQVPSTAYVAGSMLPQTRPDSRPRSEYELFLARQSTAAVWDLSRAEQVSGLSRAFARRRQGGLASAWAALKASGAQCFLASGEDVGLVLALLARGMGDTRPI